ncbi:hypothetical protein AGOR_G00064050 [Albula goreensis]|uniref:PEST proteolytic signal-containing nuclear protein n=1 Tax=Albula goreensis TaxID=1534307 RepID=A0A8T3DYB3_9TELE|nr:hypothetical protein AGOR_G00064050 [Albula goreensis]
MADERRSSEELSDDGAGSGWLCIGLLWGSVSAAMEGGGGGRGAGKRSAPEEPTGHQAPPKVSKVGFGMTSQPIKKPAPISIKLGANKPKEPVPVLPSKKPALAAVFNEDDDSEPEEMPPEAKMRMKNIGRETPTSAGPNSFNKGKHGFSDHQKLWERKLKSQTDK